MENGSNFTKIILTMVRILIIGIVTAVIDVVLVIPSTMIVESVITKSTDIPINWIVFWVSFGLIFSLLYYRLVYYGESKKP